MLRIQRLDRSNSEGSKAIDDAEQIDDIFVQPYKWNHLLNVNKSKKSVYMYAKNFHTMDYAKTFAKVELFKLGQVF